MIETMKAVVLSRFGGADAFELLDVPVPPVGARQLRVRVHATAVNPLDYQIRRGDYADLVPLPSIIGHDVSGVVEETGADVTEFAASVPASSALRGTMKTPVENLQDAIDDYASYIEDAYANADEVRSAWQAILRPLDAHVQVAGLAPGFFCRRIEFDPCPGERDADDQRTVVRLEFISHVISDVVMHLSTEDTDAVPRLDILTTMRRGVGLLDREWDQLEPLVAITRFIDRHNARVAAETA